ncbi:Ribokinase-like protein [Zychaea mexicana]|uniref:Ribokinase-like protein n=1 Tax=Zychaea mexicana TaxID=64656 RepID=UPI0022FEF8C1|nr:Ribokinase-like protein [Zychaea mexicana]KAI9478916.1 Ribokinase-like protein [Zychaea mexicana]
MSALGPKDSSRQLIAQLEAKGIRTSTCIFRKSPTPSSYIIKSNASGSRTIISVSTIEDISRDEFIRKFEMASLTKTLAFESDGKAPFKWIHFEGRNVTQAGDVVFFSKLFAERRGYSHPADFLRSVRPRCKPQAVLYCTWGSRGATCLQPNDEELHTPAPLVSQVMDSIGAGDTFIAGIMFMQMRGMPYLSSLKFACELASCKVAQEGFDGLAVAMANKKVWDTQSLPLPPSRISSMIRKYSDSDVVRPRDEANELDRDEEGQTINERLSSLSFSSSKPLL